MAVGLARSSGGAGPYDLGRAADADWRAIGEIGLVDDEAANAASDPAAVYIARGGVPMSDGSPINGSLTLYGYTSLLRRAGTVRGTLLGQS